MAYINHKIKDIFPDIAVMKSQENEAVFRGRNLPGFVRDVIVRRYSDADGRLDSDRVRQYLEAKMPNDYEALKSRLISGERVNMTVRFIIKTDLAAGRTAFSIPDAQINSDAYVSKSLLEKCREELSDGEKWGNITMNYIAPQGRSRGYIEMSEFKSFKPYSVDFGTFLRKRAVFTTEEWIDVLIATMGYDPDNFPSQDCKEEFISRLLPMVEPQLNMMELGPKGTGKSYVYNNMSKHAWLIGGGNISRAKMFYNKSTRQFGLMKHYDVVAIDEISTFGFVDPNEMQSIFKTYLEAGRTTVDNVDFRSDCGLMLMGNIPLSEEKQPLSDEYFRALPQMFHESATLDRFHAFIEGWKLPRLSVGSVLRGWTLNSEYFSTVLHTLRTRTEYEEIFNTIVNHQRDSDIRDTNAVRKVATAYCKLLFPHVRNISELSSEELESFKADYLRYCLEPAVRRRGIIRRQCHLIDKEFSPAMPEFTLR